jgi:hypothetical protein
VSLPIVRPSCAGEGANCATEGMSRAGCARDAERRQEW